MGQTSSNVKGLRMDACRVIRILNGAFDACANFLYRRERAMENERRPWGGEDRGPTLLPVLWLR